VTGADVTVPAAVASAAGRQPLRLVWANEAGGLTFAAGEGTGQRFIKWAPADSGIDLAGEAERMAWAEWNYGPGWERLLLDAYGTRPDPERTRYYRLLWDLSS
jgi:aminoglycoside phosphotransferase